MGRTWGRLYAGTRNHRKVRILREECPQFWQAFYVLLEIAFECDDGGKIYLTPERPFSIKQLSIELGTQPKQTQKLLESMQKLGIIRVDSDQIPVFLSYSERQFDSDFSKERTRKYREKQKELDDEGKTVTSQERHSDCDVTPITEQNRTEQNNTPLPPKGGTGKVKENGKIPYEEIREAWNQFKPKLLPSAIALNASRKNLIKQAWIEHPSVEWFQVFFTDINLSDHHSGRNDKNWTPEIDWILKNRLKLQEKIAAVKGKGKKTDEMDSYMEYLAERDGVSNEPQ